MTKKVRMPDGTVVGFPDDVPDEFIRELIETKFPGTAKATADARKTPAKQPEVKAEPPAGPTFLERITQPAQALRSSIANMATFGLADRLAGQLPGLTTERAREITRAEAARNPVAATAGSLIGAGMTGAAAQRAATKVAPFLAPVAGQTVRNVARSAGVGAALGGAQAAGEGEDIATGAALGGVTAGVADVALKGAAAASRAIVGKRATKAIKVLADRLKMTPDEFETALDAAEADAGRRFTLAELTDVHSAAELRLLGQHKQPVGDALRATEKRVLAERPQTMRAQIERGGVGTVAGLDAARKQAADTTMGQIGKSTVALPPTVPPKLQKLIADHADTLARNGDDTAQKLLANGEIDIRTLDNVRQDLGKLAKANPGEGWDRVRDYATMLATRANKRYQGYLNEYSARSRQIKGMKAGQAGTDPSTLTGPARQDAQTMEYAVGREGGTRSRLANAASTERGAVTTADKLRQAPRDVADALGGPETARFQRLGAAETASAERLSDLVTTPEAASKRAEQVAQIAMEGAAVLGTGSVMTGFQVHWLRRTLLMAKDGLISAKTAREAADLLTNPARAREGIALLRAKGVSDRKIAEAVQAVAVSLGQTAGGAQ